MHTFYKIVKDLRLILCLLFTWSLGVFALEVDSPEGSGTGSSTGSIGDSSSDISVGGARLGQITDFFNEADHPIRFSNTYHLADDFAMLIADNTALFVDLQDIDLTGAGRVIILHPASFIGAAIRSSDPAALDPIAVDSGQVAEVLADEGGYRELCAFEHRLGGTNIAGTLMATLGDGQSVQLNVEVATSANGFEAIEGATEAGGLVISWPNKYCRGVKINNGSCLANRCGMTLGDMIDLAGQAGLPIPTAILAGGVDAVAEWLGAQGYAVNGHCGQVEFLWFIPVGCQCIYVQF